MRTESEVAYQRMSPFAAAKQTAVKEPWEYSQRRPESTQFEVAPKRAVSRIAGYIQVLPLETLQKVPEKLPKMIKNKSYLVDSNTCHEPSQISSPNQLRFAARDLGALCH
jgi:hypothetical protein